MNTLILLACASLTIGKAHYEFTGEVETASFNHPEAVYFIQPGDEVYGDFTINLGTPGVPWKNDPDALRIHYPGALVDFNVTIGDSLFQLSGTQNLAVVDMSGTSIVSIGFGMSDDHEYERGEIAFVVDRSGTMLSDTTLAVFEDLYLYEPIFRVSFHATEYEEPDPRIAIDLQTLTRPFVPIKEWNPRERRSEKRAVPEPSGLVMAIICFGLLLHKLRR
jgi:hypothetical protein